MSEETAQAKLDALKPLLDTLKELVYGEDYPDEVLVDDLVKNSLALINNRTTLLH